MDNQVIKNNTLPEQIKDVLLAEYQRVLSYKIRKKYNLSFDDKRVIEDLVEKMYYNQLPINQLIGALGEKIETQGIDFNFLAKDIVGLRLYIAKPYFEKLGQDIDAYIKSLGEFSPEYQKNVEIMKQAMADEKNGTYDNDKYLALNGDKSRLEKIVFDDTEDAEEEVETNKTEASTQEMKTHLEEFFKESLGDVLDLDDADLIDEINDDLIIVLSEDPSAKKYFTDFITNSKVVIGKNKLVFDDKEIEATSDNWLKDFFRVMGAEFFDTLGIEKYIISSPNAKTLSKEEKDILRRFLTLYYNLRYFPAPFAAIPIEQWNVIPNITKEAIDTDEIIKDDVKNDLAIPEIKKTITPTSTPAPALVIPKQKVDSPEVTELKNMLLQYPEGSLERAAIEEEIKNLQNG